MATFQDLETSVESGSRIELYTLAMGSTVYRMHNSVETTLVYAGDDFDRTSVKRGAIATGQEYLEIMLPGSHAFPLKFTEIAPGQTASMTIQSYHRDEPSDVRVIYKGVVRAVAFTQNMAHSALSLVPISEAMQRTIPERTFQAACNNVLFDADCKVSEGSHAYINQVLAIAGNIVTISNLETTKGDGWATGGYVAYGALDYRLVLEQDGDDLILVLPFTESILGENVSTYAGCDHSIAVCDVKFLNEINFGGHPYVPTKNIFLTGIE